MPGGSQSFRSSSHWRAVCDQSRTYRSAGGRWKRTCPAGTSPAAYPTASEPPMMPRQPKPWVTGRGPGCKGLAAGRGGKRRPGTINRSWEHRWPRGVGGAHPGRVSCARNVETPSGSEFSFGSVGRSQEGRNSSAGQEAQEADAGGRKAAGPGTCGCLSRWLSREPAGCRSWRPGPERGADVGW